MSNLYLSASTCPGTGQIDRMRLFAWGAQTRGVSVRGQHVAYGRLIDRGVERGRGTHCIVTRSKIMHTNGTSTRSSQKVGRENMTNADQ